MIARFDQSSRPARAWQATAAALSLLLGGIAVTGAVHGQSAAPAARTPSGAAAEPTSDRASIPSTRPTVAENPTSAIAVAGPHRVARAANATPAALAGAAAPHAAVDAEHPPGSFHHDAPGGHASADLPRVSAAGAGSAVQGTDARSADSRSASRLQKPVSVDFRNGTLGDALAYLSGTVGVDVFVDWPALEGIAVTRDAPIDLRLNEPAPAEQVLRWVLRSAGGDQLGFAIDHGVILVSDRSALESMTVTRAYDVSDLRGEDPQRVQMVVTELIAPSSWRETGGERATVRMFGTKMLVTQTEPNHRQIERLLELLRETPPGRASATAENARAALAAPPAALAPPAGAAAEDGLTVLQRLPVVGAMFSAREQAALQRTTSNARQIVVAIHMYVNENHGKLPVKFPDDLKPYLGDDAEQVLTNPRQPEHTPGFVYVRPAEKLTQVKATSETVVLHEAGKWIDGQVVGFADGHVEFILDKEAFDRYLKSNPGKPATRPTTHK